MDEGNPGTSASDPRLGVDETGTGRSEVSEGGVDGDHRIGDMMKTLTSVGHKSTHRGFRPQWLKQLDERATHRDHRLFDTLALHRFPVERFHQIALTIPLDGGIEISNGDGHMVEVEELHPWSAYWVPADLSHAARYHPPSVSNSVITSIARTPVGRYGGALRDLRAVDLGGVAISAAVDRSGVDPSVFDEVVFGHVLQAGEGQITSRQAAVKGGLPMTIPSLTVNKVCLSGMAAIGLADRAIRLGESKFVMTGGMESMSNAPHVLRELRWGARIGDAEMVDVMQYDGLFCAFDRCTMGESSDRKNTGLGIGRAEQDEWAARSHQLAAAATSSGHFADEIVPVLIPQTRGDAVEVVADEGIRPDSTVGSLGRLRPAFVSDGTITAGNASQISDGAAAVVVADREAAEAAGAPVIAEILAYGQIGGPDATLHERPAEALLVALKKAGPEPSDLDLVEINEAFAAVTLWSARMLDIPESKVNVNGGAVALGHPLGATGARLVVTLVNALRHRGGGVGAATLCGGGGQGDAIVVRVS